MEYIPNLGFAGILTEKEIKRLGKEARIVKCSTGDCITRLLLYRKRVTVGVY